MLLKVSTQPTVCPSSIDTYLVSPRKDSHVKMNVKYKQAEIEISTILSSGDTDNIVVNCHQTGYCFNCWAIVLFFSKSDTNFGGMKPVSEITPDFTARNC